MTLRSPQKADRRNQPWRTQRGQMRVSESLRGLEVWGHRMSALPPTSDVLVVHYICPGKRTYDDRLAPVNRRSWQVFSTSEIDPTRTFQR
jgi:hypothetical protein